LPTAKKALPDVVTATKRIMSDLVPHLRVPPLLLTWRQGGDIQEYELPAFCRAVLEKSQLWTYESLARPSST